MWFSRSDVASMRRGDENSVVRVSPLSDEEPSIVMKVGVDIVWKVIGEDGCNGSDSVT